MPRTAFSLHTLICAALSAGLPAHAGILSTTEANVVAVPAPGGSGLTLRAVVYSGSADDPAGKEGLAWLTGQVLLKEAELLAASPSVGLRAGVGKDVIALTVETPEEDLDRMIGILAATLARPSFDPVTIEAARTGQKAALEAALREPDAVAREAFDAFVFRGHPYAHAPAGRLSALERIIREDLAAFHAAHFLKGNIAIGVAGVSPEAPASRLRQELARLPDGEPARQPRPISWPARPRVVVVEEPAAAGGTALRVGHALNVTRAHPDYFALRVAEFLIGSPAAVGAMGFSIEVADVEPGDDAAHGLPRRQQALVIDAAASPAEAAVRARLAAKALNDLTRGSADTALVDAARQAAKELPVFPPGDPRRELAARLDEPLFRTVGFAERYAAGLDAVDPAALRQAIGRGVHPDRVVIVAVVPDAKAFIEAVTLSPSGGAASARTELTRDDFEILTADSLFR